MASRSAVGLYAEVHLATRLAGVRVSILLGSPCTHKFCVSREEETRIRPSETHHCPPFTSLRGHTVPEDFSVNASNDQTFSGDIESL